MADTPRKVRIAVTWEDIKNGKRTSASSCPIALAAKRATGIRGLCADSAGLFKMRGGQKFDVPQKVERFVHAFDRGISVKPFVFYATPYRENAHD